MDETARLAVQFSTLYRQGLVPGYLIGAKNDVVVAAQKRFLTAEARARAIDTVANEAIKKMSSAQRRTLATAVESAWGDEPHRMREASSHRGRYSDLTSKELEGARQAFGRYLNRIQSPPDLEVMRRQLTDIYKEFRARRNDPERAASMAGISENPSLEAYGPGIARARSIGRNHGMSESVVKELKAFAPDREDSWVPAKRLLDIDTRYKAAQALARSGHPEMAESLSLSGRGGERLLTAQGVAVQPMLQRGIELPNREKFVANHTRDLLKATGLKATEVKSLAAKALSLSQGLGR